MKSSLFLAFFVALAVADIRIFPSNVYTPPNVRTQQPVYIQNNAPAGPNGAGIISNVTFEVFVVSLQAGTSSVDYTNSNVVPCSSPNSVTGAYVGSIAGGVVNGTASWFLTGTAGSYGVIYYARYWQNGRVYSVFNISYIQISNQAPPSRDVEEAQNTVSEDVPANYAVEARDGSSTDFACVSCNFQGENMSPTWNKYTWTNTPAVFNIKYSAICNDSNVAINLLTANATANSQAGGSGNIMFTISGRNGVYTVTWTLKYSKTVPSAPQSTWVSNAYVFYITNASNPNGTHFRDVQSQVSADFDAHLRDELFASMKASKSIFALDSTKDQQTVSLRLAVSAGVAGVALVALIAVVVVVAVLRSKKSNAPLTASL